MASFAIAFLQRPGETVVDTRLELSVDPTVFLERIFYLWSATTDLGHVQGGQFNGYLFPMAPWFALGDQLGVPMWIVQRMWLGTLLLLAAWGAVRLMDALLERPSFVASSGAALLFALSPYVVLFTSRGTVTLLAYAALPWLMLAVHRGLTEPRAWRMPAVIGLVLASTGGGVNAAVIAFALLGPLALAAYEIAIRRVPARSALAFGWRATLLGAVGSLWWAIPVLLQSRFGVDILIYTEQPRTIWATTSFSELIRQLGFWGLYSGVGFGGQEPFMGVAATYLFNPAVIVAGFLVPAFAALTFPLVRRWSYAPFFGLLSFGALVAMFAGYPRQSRLSALLLDLYSGFPALQFLRTTYKGMPLLTLALACLGGAGAAALVSRAREGRLRVFGRSLPPAALAVLVVVPALTALPLLAGRAIDREQAYGNVPDWWTDSTADAGRSGGRTMVLPGEMFGWYEWGGTMDPVAPGLRSEPIAIREIVPYADSRSAFLQIAVDDLVQQDRLVPDQLSPLLRLMGVRQVVVARDGRLRRNGAVAPVAVEAALSEQSGLTPVEDYGPRRTQPPLDGRGYPRTRLAQLTRRSAPGAGSGVRLAAGPSTILEGDAEGITELAAHELLDIGAPLFLAGDVSGSRLAHLAGAGAKIVLSDSARRRSFVAPRTRGNRGPTLTPSDSLDREAATFNPFPGRGTNGQTVALYSGLRRLTSPTAPGWTNFPQYRPYAALDDSLRTSWRADENVNPDRWYMELELAQPQRVRAIEVVPQQDRRGRTESILVSVNGGAERRVSVQEGPNRIALNADELRTLRIRVDKIAGNKDTRGAGGITELRVPGLRVRERLRLPLALSRATRGVDLSHSPLDVLLQRTTADFPYRAGADALDPEADHPLAMLDAEEGLERVFELPEPRRFAVRGWGSIAPDAPDVEIDRLARLAPGWRFRSASRFEGVPSRRSASAFDGDRRTAWIGDVVPGEPAWIEWKAPEPHRVRSIALRPGPAGYHFPTRVRVTGSGISPFERTVGSDGLIAFPRPRAVRSLRITVLGSQPRGTGGVREVRAVAVGELEVPGLVFPAPRRQGRFTTGCGALSVEAAGRVAPVAIAGTLSALDAGRALSMRGCSELSLPGRRVRLSMRPGKLLRPDHLLLSSRAPIRPTTEAEGPGRVVSTRRGGPPGAIESVRLALTRPAWLVLEQSYSPGWRATCRERDGLERDLGDPTAIDGYANGWRVTPDCVSVDFAFGPQRLALAGYAVSALGCLAMAALLLGAWVSRRRRGRAVETVEVHESAQPPADDLLRVRWRRALPVAVAIGVVGGALFSLRMGALMLPFSLIMMRAGLSVGRLSILGSAGVAALPVVYLLSPAEDRGGFNFDYALHFTRAHYLAVLAVCCLAAAATLALLRLRAVTPSAPGSRSSR